MSQPLRRLMEREDGGWERGRKWRKGEEQREKEEERELQDEYTLYRQYFDGEYYSFLPFML